MRINFVVGTTGASTLNISEERRKKANSSLFSKKIWVLKRQSKRLDGYHGKPIPKRYQIDRQNRLRLFDSSSSSKIQASRSRWKVRISSRFSTFSNGLHKC